MQGLLANPVVQGLLTDPNTLRARARQEAAQMMPRAGGGMIGAPSPQQPQNAGWDRALSSIGNSGAKLIEGIQANKIKEQEDAQIAAFIKTQPPERQEQLAALASTPAGRAQLMGGIAKQAFPDPTERKVLKGADGYYYYQDTGERVLRDVKKPAEPNPTRQVPRNGRIVTEEFAGGEWKQIGSSAQFAPKGAVDDDIFGKGAQGKALEMFSRIGLIPEAQRTPEQQARYLSAEWLLSQDRTDYDSTGRPFTITPKPLPVLSRSPQGGGAPVPAPGGGNPMVSTASVATPQATPSPARPTIAPDEATQKRVSEIRDTITKTSQGITNLQNALALNEKAYAGPAADVLQGGARFFGVDEESLVATTEFENILLKEILPMMRQIFGANPTEGEREILLEMQAAKTMSRPERARLIENSIKELRTRGENAKIDLRDLREGNTFQPRQDSQINTNFGSMDFNELLSVDVMKLTPSEASQYQDRLKKVMEAQ